MLLTFVAITLTGTRASRANELSELKSTAAQLLKRIEALERQQQGATSATASAAPKKKATAAASPAAKPSGETPAPPAAGDGGKTVANADGTADLAVGGATRNTFDVPDSPAAAILGVTPQKIVRPSNPEELIASLLSGVNERGDFQSGFAIDISPYKFLHPKIPGQQAGETHAPTVLNARYNDGQRADLPQAFYALDPGAYFERLLTRSQLSLVVSKGVTDADKATRGAIGFQTTLMDETDPILRLFSADKLRQDEPREVLRQLGRSHKQAKDSTTGVSRDRKTGEVKPRLGGHYNSSWNVGIAQAFVSPDGKGTDVRQDGFGVYSTYSYGFEGTDYRAPEDGLRDRVAQTLQKHTQLLLQVRYRDHELVPDPANKGRLIDKDTVRLAGRLRLGLSDFNVSFDGSLMEESLAGGAYKQAYAVAFDVEKKLTDNSWLTLSMGKEFEHADGQNPVLVIGGVKVGFGRDKPAPKQ